MTASAQKTVSVSIALDHDLYRDMTATVVGGKRTKMLNHVASEVSKRLDHEFTVERRKLSGETFVADNASYKEYVPLQKLAKSSAFAALAVATKLNVENYINPQAKVGGKSSIETSNLKAYNKMLHIAEVILNDTYKVEPLVKCGFACAYMYALQNRKDGERYVIVERKNLVLFLMSSGKRYFKTGTQDFLDAINTYFGNCASHSGAGTQASQIIRTSVAVGLGKDVRGAEGKDMILDLENPVLTALLMRFGVITK